MNGMPQEQVRHYEKIAELEEDNRKTRGERDIWMWMATIASLVGAVGWLI